MGTTKLTQALLKNTKNPKLAWQLFKRIQSSPSNPCFLSSVPTIARILIRSKMLPEIDHLHLLLLSSQPQEKSLPSLISLVNLLAKSGFFDKAFSQFQSIRKMFPQNPPSICLYNVLFGCCIKERRSDCVLWLYKDMVLAGVSPETYTFNLLICGLCDLGHLEDARDLFDKMPEKGCLPNEFSFGILVRGYCRFGLANKGLELLDEMRSSGILPNRVVYNTLISSFYKEGKTGDVEKLVERIREDGVRDVHN